MTLLPSLHRAPGACAARRRGAAGAAAGGRRDARATPVTATTRMPTPRSSAPRWRCSGATARRPRAEYAAAIQRVAGCAPRRSRDGRRARLRPGRRRGAAPPRAGARSPARMRTRCVRWCGSRSRASAIAAADRALGALLGTAADAQGGRAEGDRRARPGGRRRGARLSTARGIARAGLEAPASRLALARTGARCLAPRGRGTASAPSSAGGGRRRQPARKASSRARAPALGDGEAALAAARAAARRRCRAAMPSSRSTCSSCSAATRRRAAARRRCATMRRRGAQAERRLAHARLQPCGLRRCASSASPRCCAIRQGAPLAVYYLAVIAERRGDRERALRGYALLAGHRAGRSARHGAARPAADRRVNATQALRDCSRRRCDAAPSRAHRGRTRKRASCSSRAAPRRCARAASRRRCARFPGQPGTGLPARAYCSSAPAARPRRYSLLEALHRARPRDATLHQCARLHARRSQPRAAARRAADPRGAAVPAGQPRDARQPRLGAAIGAAQTAAALPLLRARLAAVPRRRHRRALW